MEKQKIHKKKKQQQQTNKKTKQTNKKKKKQQTNKKTIKTVYPDIQDKWTFGFDKLCYIISAYSCTEVHCIKYDWQENVNK